MSDSKESKRRKKRDTKIKKKKKPAATDDDDDDNASTSRPPPVPKYKPAIAIPAFNPPPGRDNPTASIRKRIFEDEEKTFEGIISLGGSASKAVSKISDESEWVDLDISHILQLREFFKMDTNIRLVTDIILSDMFSGYIRFVRPGRKMKKMAEKWYARTWSNWCRAVVCDIWTQGFSLVQYKPHSQYRLQPVCIPITSKMQIKFQLTSLGTPKFAVITQLKTGRGVPQAVFMPDVYVICHEAPLFDGTIVSRTATLLPEACYLQAIKELYELASSKAVSPTLITEHSLVADDPSTRGTHAGTFSRSVPLADSAVAADQSALRNSLDRLSELREIASRLDHVGGMEAVREYERQEARLGHQSKRYDLPANYVLSSKAPEPKAPENLQFFIQTMIENTFMIFQIPPAIIVVNNARGRTTESASALRVYRLSMQRYKEMAVTFISDFLHIGFDVLWIKQFAQENLDREGFFSEEELDDVTDIDVSMPGLPEWDSLIQLNSMGIMKQEAMSKFAWMNFGLSEDDVNPTPTLKPLTILTVGKDLLQEEQIAAELEKSKIEQTEREKDRKFQLKQATLNNKANSGDKNPAKKKKAKKS